jgi:hypothetical protein
MASPTTRRRPAVLLVVMALLGLAVFQPRAATAAGASVTPINAACGTWVLQQATTMAELNGAAAQIDRVLALPGVVGLSLRVPWNAIDGDLALYERGLELARAQGKSLAVRFMAGRHTPARVFEAGAHAFVSAAGDVIPKPFGDDGTAGNPVFEQEFDRTVGVLATWARANGVRLLHLPWYGFAWAEIYNGDEIQAAPGYSYTAWLEGHTRLIALALGHAGDDLAVEFSMSGHWGGQNQGSGQVADAIVGLAGPGSPGIFVQGNGLGVFNNRTTDRPIFHAKQMYDGADYDWATVFGYLTTNDERYVEVYTASFSRPKQAQLAAEVARFGATCDNQAPTADVPALGESGAVRGPVPVGLSGIDTVGVATLALLVDGITVASAVGPATTVVWDTTTVTGGPHTLRTRAGDAAGNTATSDAITVTVDNEAPIPSVVTPTDGALLRGTVQVGMTASDNIGPNTLELLVDGNAVAVSGGPSADVGWDTTLVTGGSHTLAARATDAAGNTATSAVTNVTVDNTPPAISLSDAVITEGSSGTRTVKVTFSLSFPTTGTVSMAYGTVNQTATAGSDFSASSGTVTFPAGTTTVDQSFTVLGDTTDEPDEAFLVRASDPSGATLLDGTGVVTITDDDPSLPAISVSNGMVGEPNSGTRPAKVTFSLSARAPKTVTVLYATADQTATGRSDYTSSSGKVSFPAGTTSVDVWFSVRGDRLRETNETFRVAASSPNGATLVDGTGLITIIDND